PALVGQKLPGYNSDKNGYAEDIANHSSLLNLLLPIHGNTSPDCLSWHIQSDFQSAGNAIALPSPPAACAAASAAPTCGTGMAGIRAGAPRARLEPFPDKLEDGSPILRNHLHPRHFPQHREVNSAETQSRQEDVDAI